VIAGYAGFLVIEDLPGQYIYRIALRCNIRDKLTFIFPGEMTCCGSSGQISKKCSIVCTEFRDNGPDLTH